LACQSIGGWQEDGSLNTLEYTAEAAYDCAEIVYRLKYIIEAATRRIRKGRGVADRS